jgi:hypothetical protein
VQGVGRAVNYVEIQWLPGLMRDVCVYQFAIYANIF